MSKAKPFWTSFSKIALDWVYPPQCALCTRIGTPAVCEVCASEMTPLPTLYEERLDDVLSFRLSVYSYDGRAGQAVRRLKYSRATSLAGFMADAIKTMACEADLMDGRIVAPVPIHWRRRASRGFNQAELLCGSFPRPSVRKDLLIRTRPTSPQAGLSADQRRRNLTGAFRVQGRVDGQRILLVDDVLTTGQTGRECGRVLLEAGAIEVGLVTFAAEL
ncbi:MAG: hypothetical protein QOJ65_1012 [Fimbriimonadaceae bacterium]|jgi:ComF family protein|nr:hypothetical protein [Fimbriimonadaceae bacterium]